jgi:HlyD family secretion protein
MKLHLPSKRLLLLPLLAVVGLVLWNTGFRRADGGGLPPLQTVAVDRGDVAQRIVAHGTLQPQRQVHVGSQVSGVIEQIYVDFNSRVTRGQVLARIDPSTFAAAVRSAEAELAAAEAAHELARLQWRRVEELREHQIVAASELEQAASQFRQAEAQLSVRRQNLERARRELERCTILSPTDGMVIRRAVDVGQTVAASLSAPVLFEIASDLTRMQIHAHVSEADIGAVREGQPVRFQVDAHRGRRFTGDVVQVRNAPHVVDNVVHYETIIAVDNSDGLLKPGMTAEVNIVTAEATDAVRARNTALRARLPDAIRPADPGGP